MTDNYNHSKYTFKAQNAFTKTSEALKGEMETSDRKTLNSCQKQNQDCKNQNLNFTQPKRRKRTKLMLSISAMGSNNKDWEQFGRWTLIACIFLGGCNVSVFSYFSIFAYKN